MTQKTETPDETMRRAAKHMRARAEEATEGPWRQDDNNLGDVIAVRMDPTGEFDDDQETVVDGMLNSADAAHIGSWGPDVALTVAAWLDEVAADRHASLPAWVDDGALVIARAYLGEPTWFDAK